VSEAAITMATEDSGPTFRYRLVPKIANAIIPANPVYRPTAGARPARSAYASAWGTMTAQRERAAIESVRRDRGPSELIAARHVDTTTASGIVPLG
jgi:hypothetical protein